MLPPLKALPVFEAVARLNSFSLAAQELNLSQSAVSHQIRVLENHLGESLFHRQGRYLSLTPEGKHYLDAISSSLSQIAHASSLIRGESETKVRIAVYSSFAVCWLMPRLPDLMRLHPNLDISITMSHSLLELSDKTADCFITTDHEKRGFDFKHIYRERLFPVCSPAFYESMKNALNIRSDKDMADLLKKHPETLGEFPLATSFGIYNEYTEDWRRWFAEAGHPLPDDLQLHKFSHLLLAYEAAKYSLGIGLINDYMFNEDRTRDDLIRLPTHHIETGDEFYFAYKYSRRNEPGIAEVKRWLIHEAAGLQSDD
ncbi:LysR substrate-binding domain-containing protein [Vibrio rhizosphaerae]|uniref:LysR substrate-binding domain-containing protein n=1 Tax=Vibrio rhizosphaerae TaxID=398736 RepID=A0ABU4IX44_9VIBR|nr:LysR substrate-binding domain-containing protein [Vibrio rhizosphaerae]MDW6093965.1 LysR substrate-binding domain-containing protein [Vibrio rhizosphaerae]